MLSVSLVFVLVVGLPPMAIYQLSRCGLCFGLQHAGYALAQVVKTRVNDVFYECDGNGDCATKTKPRQGQQWGLEAIQAPQAWSITKGSKAVKVQYGFRFPFLVETGLEAIQSPQA